MTVNITEIPQTVTDAAREPAEDGLGAMQTERGNLPLRGLDIRSRVTGLTAGITITQRFHNPHDEPIEATYIFPLPERAAVTAMTMTVADRTINAELAERAAARATYREAVSAGKRAAIAEAERADVFTMRVGNIAAGEEAVVTLELVGPLAYEDDEATLRIPLVVAPRFIPGEPIGGAAGDGYAADTDSVPDASRITPPVLLPGFPNPVELSIEAEIDPAGLRLSRVRSSLHAAAVDERPDGRFTVKIQPGERVNRDFMLRFDYADPEQVQHSLVTVPDAEPADDPTSASASTDGTFQLTVLPPQITAGTPERDVVVLLDQSASMSGWKMVAARRAAARIVDTLGSNDRFAVRCFDNQVTAPPSLPDGLVAAGDRHRFRAVEFLAAARARGGTQMLAPLRQAVDLLSTSGSQRDRVLVLVTDGQVGNEDQILAELTERLGGLRVHVVGIDRAVNAGFLYRLALAGRGRCELVESEDRLDEACARIHRRIVAPVVTDLRVDGDGMTVDADSIAPRRLPDLFVGSPLTLSGRYSSLGDKPTISLKGIGADGRPWHTSVAATGGGDTVIRTGWARARLRDLEDDYAVGAGDLDALERRIVDMSLRYGVLSRFTAFVAVDARVVDEGGRPRRIVQPVEMPEGWDMVAPGPAPGAPPAPMGQVRLAAAGAPMASMDWMSDEATRGGTPEVHATVPNAIRAPSPRRSAARPAARVGAWRRGRVMTDQQLRDQYAAELRALRDAGEPILDIERRAILSDLRSRLTAATTGATIDEALRDLLTALAACDEANPPTGEALTALWRRTIDTLDRLTADASPPPPAAATEQPATTERDDDRPFWKRRPR